MKRDMDLVRNILLAIEASNQSPLDWVDLPKFPGQDDEVISYHVALLAEADLVLAQDISTDDGFEVRATRLTWNGHEFLDSVRDPEIWRRTKEGAAKIGGAGLDILVEIAKGYARHFINEKLGIDLLAS